MSKQYKAIDVEGTEIGPLSEPEIAAMVKAGRMGQDSLVWDPDSQIWSPLRQVFPGAYWRQSGPPRASSAPLPGPPPSPWEAPESGLEALRKASGPDGLDWTIAGLMFAFMLSVFLFGTHSRNVPDADGATTAGYACGELLWVVLFPAGYLVLRRSVRRAFCLVGCVGPLLVLIVVGIAAGMMAAVHRRDRGQARTSLEAGPSPEAAMKRVRPAAWVSLEVPGDLTPAASSEGSVMIARMRHFVASAQTCRMDIYAFEMQKGFRVTPKNAILDQKAMLVKQGVPQDHIDQEMPIKTGGGEGYRLDYWVQEPGKPPLKFRALALSFPAGDKAPQKGLVTVISGTGEDADALMEECQASIRYEAKGREASQEASGASR